jgi:hypothetical protein
MLLDTADWQHAREQWGDRWNVLANGKGGLYVAASRAALRHLTRQPSGYSVALLARLLTGAQPGEIVIYANGDSFDLRRSNLVKLDRKAARLWRQQQRIV